MGIIPVIKPSMSQGPKIWRLKESSKRTQKPNSKLLSLKLKTSSMKSLLTRRRTKTKGIMERKKSSVHTAGRASTLNMPAWKRNLMKLLLFLREITSIFQKAFEGEISKIRNHNMKKVMPSWEALRSPKHSELILELQTTWWLKETPFHPCIPTNPSLSTWEMTPPSFQKDKVRLILRMDIFQMFLCTVSGIKFP